MKYPITPVTFRLLVRPERFEEYSTGGILKVTKSQLEKEQSAVNRGKVLAIGPVAGNYFRENYKNQDAWNVKVGDYIVFKRHHGLQWSLQEDSEDKYILLNDEDVLGTLDPALIDESKYV